MLRQYSRILLAAITALLYGCASQPSPEITSYTIKLATSDDSASARPSLFPKVLKVSIPESSSAIMSHDILYQGSDYALNAYAYSRWSDTPNKMLGNQFISSIRQSSAFRSVLPVSSRGKGDYVLESTLYEFLQQINSTTDSEGRIRITFYLINNKNGVVVASKVISATETAHSVDARGGVGALNKASNTVAIKLNKWLLSLEIE